MASKVGLGSVGGALLGTLSFLIPGVGPMLGVTIITTLGTTGAAIGWEMAKADLAQEVARRAMGGIENTGNRALDTALRGVENITLKIGEGSYHLLVLTGRMMRTWNAVALTFVIDVGVLYTRSLLDKQVASCVEQLDSCEDLRVARYFTTGCFVLVTSAATGAAVLFLWDNRRGARLDEAPQEIRASLPEPEQQREPVRHQSNIVSNGNELRNYRALQPLLSVASLPPQGVQARLPEPEQRRDPVQHQSNITPSGNELRSRALQSPQPVAPVREAHRQIAPRREEDAPLAVVARKARQWGNWYIRSVMPIWLGGSNSSDIWGDLEQEESMRKLAEELVLSEDLRNRMRNMRIDSGNHY